jgi:hypothetical protein
MKKRTYDRQNMPNAARHRPMGTITMSPLGWDRLDAQRGDKPRGMYVEALLWIAASDGLVARARRA